MANVQAIQWVQNGTVNINVSNTTQAIALGGSTRGYQQIEVMNDGTATVWVAFGDSTITTASTTGKPIGAGSDMVTTVGPGVTHMAAIAAGSTGYVYATPGSGI